MHKAVKTSQIQPLISLKDVSDFGDYVDYLSVLTRETFSDPSAYIPALDLALDGQPISYLRHTYSPDELRNSGTFFTGSAMADKVLRLLSPQRSSGTVLDPACGVGDLLIAYARKLPVKKSLRATLDGWGTHLAGFDLNEKFIRAAKYRLALLACRSGAVPDCAARDILSFFPNLVCGNGLSSWKRGDRSLTVLINPPFTRVTAPSDCVWGQGLVSQAALFIDHCVSQSPTGTRIVAILPDVLRSGTNYQRWRERVEERGKIERIEIIGRFDRQTDVDVFSLDFSVGRECRRAKSWIPVASKETVGSYFDVHVGPVVPHRYQEKGAWHPYLHARNVPAWSIILLSDEHIRWAGRVFPTPFVLVRRTSSPGDSGRITASIVQGLDSAALENHLLVLVPKDGTLKKCRRLLKLLQSPSARNWVNRRIRCRHLTVGALKELPWDE